MRTRADEGRTNDGSRPGGHPGPGCGLASVVGLREDAAGQRGRSPRRQRHRPGRPRDRVRAVGPEQGRGSSLRRQFHVVRAGESRVQQRPAIAAGAGPGAPERRSLLGAPRGHRARTRTRARPRRDGDRSPAPVGAPGGQARLRSHAGPGRRTSRPHGGGAGLLDFRPDGRRPAHGHARARLHDGNPGGAPDRPVGPVGRLDGIREISARSALDECCRHGSGSNDSSLKTTRHSTRRQQSWSSS